jgi:hypothetical protein
MPSCTNAQCLQRPLPMTETFPKPLPTISTAQILPTAKLQCSSVLTTEHFINVGIRNSALLLQMVEAIIY